MVIFEHFFSDLGAQGEVQETYLCTSTKPSPPRDNELWKKAKKISGQAYKCARWMPRYGPAMKDVASCDKPREAASKLRSGDVRMGKPDGGYAPSSGVSWKPTRGTETSKYPEE